MLPPDMCPRKSNCCVNMGTGVGLICASRRHFTPKYPEWSFAMRPANTLLTRREFLQASAVATISAPVPASNVLTQVAPQQPNDDVLPARQKERRKELWGLLRVEESTSGCRCSLSVSAVSSFVPG